MAHTQLPLVIRGMVSSWHQNLNLGFAHYSTDMTHIDKNSIKHFSICFLLSLVGAYGASFALGASLTKEYYDKKSYGHWCWWDLLFDFLGIVSGQALHLWILKSWDF